MSGENVKTAKRQNVETLGNRSVSLRFMRANGPYTVELGADRRLDRGLSRYPPAPGSFHQRGGLSGLDSYRERAEELYATNGIATGIVDRFVENVVGPSGIKLQVQSADKGWNEQAEGLMDEWAMDGADARGMDDLYTGLQRNWFRGMMVGGDIGIIKLRDGSLQTIDGGDISTPHDKLTDDSIVDGVQLSRLLKPLAFYVESEDKNQTKHTAVPAHHFIFYTWGKLKPKDTRGVSAFRQAIDSNILDQIEGNIEAVVAAAQMAAMLGLLITDGPGGGDDTLQGTTPTTDAAGNAAAEMNLEPGMVKGLAYGSTVTQVNPTQPGQNWPDFIATLGRVLGLPFGLPLELVFLDFSRTSYSSARTSMLQVQRVFRGHQERFINRVLRNIYEWRISKFISAGKLSPRPDALKHNWIAPGWQWVDPEKEGKANLLALDGGWTTVTDICAGLGKDFSEVVARRKQEIEALKTAGLEVVRSKQTRDLGSDGATKGRSDGGNGETAKRQNVKTEEKKTGDAGSKTGDAGKGADDARDDDTKNS